MSDVSPTTHVARLCLDEATAQRIMDVFVERFDPDDTAAAWFEDKDGRWVVELYFSRMPDAAALHHFVAQEAGEAAAGALAVSTIEPRDWVEASLAGLKPVAAGRFVIHGRHDRAHIAPNRLAVEVEAALAFGTGHHATTRGCLIAIDALARRSSRRKPVKNHLSLSVRALAPPSPQGPLSGRGGRARILDLGTGSGVLAMAAAKALRRSVVAGDIDRTAVKAAQDNVRRNHLAPLVELVHAAGTKAPRIRLRAPYDLVFANILLAPLQLLAAPLARVLAPGARVVLSGLLYRQANAAMATYRAHGLALERRIDLDGWVTLVMARRRSRA